MKITEENKKVVNQIFEVNAECNQVWFNKKGEYFTKWDLAAVSVEDPKEELKNIVRESVAVLKADTAQDLVDLNIDEIKEFVKSVDNKELLIEAVQLETQNDNRKGAKEAIGNRIEELNKNV